MKFRFDFNDLDDEQVIEIINAWNQTVEDRFTDHDTHPIGFETLMYFMNEYCRQFTEYLNDKNNSLREEMAKIKMKIGEVLQA